MIHRSFYHPVNHTEQVSHDDCGAYRHGSVTSTVTVQDPSHSHVSSRRSLCVSTLNRSPNYIRVSQCYHFSPLRWYSITIGHSSNVRAIYIILPLGFSLPFLPRGRGRGVRVCSDAKSAHALRSTVNVVSILLRYNFNPSSILLRCSCESTHSLTIHSIFGYKLVFSESVEGTIDAICGSIKSKMAATAITPQPVSRVTIRFKSRS